MCRCLLTGKERERKMITTITTNSGLNFFFKGKSYAVSSNHERFEDIKMLLSDGEGEKVIELLRPITIVKKASVALSEFLEVNEDTCQVFLITEVDGEQKKENISYSSIGKRILRFVQEGLPYDSLGKFLNNLIKNPSYNSRKQLYNFLEHSNLPITDDGHFLAYKGVRVDYLDCHSGKFNNSPGQVLEMPRSEIDDNPNNHCSAGFHAGTINYARSFGPKVVIVKINPADVVSVPNDHNAQKLRTTRYEVLSDYERDFNDDYEPLSDPETETEKSGAQSSWLDESDWVEDYDGYDSDYDSDYDEDYDEHDEDSEPLPVCFLFDGPYKGKQITKEYSFPMHKICDLDPGCYNPPEGDNGYLFVMNLDSLKGELVNAISKSGKMRTDRYGGLWVDPKNYLNEAGFFLDNSDEETFDIVSSLMQRSEVEE